jgi:alpha-1,6-mannosyltransferase
VVLSHDVYSYIAYARLGALHGLDPYVRPPSAAPGDPVFAQVDWRAATSTYGPLFTLSSYPLAGLSVAAAVAAVKALGAACVLALAALVARLAAMRGVDPLRAAAFVALNPLVLVHVVGGAHNDGPAILLALLGVSAVLVMREAEGGAAFVAAFGVKATAVYAAPFALLGARRHSRFASGALAALLALVLVALAAFGWHWLDAFTLAGSEQGRTSHMSVPITFARLTGTDPRAVRIAALFVYGALLAWLLAWTWRGGDWVRAAAWAGAGLLLASAWLLPWYLIWALPLAALSRDRPLKLLLLALTAFQLGSRIPL